MGYFDYPLDTKYLLRKKKSIKKELLQQDNVWIEKRVAVLGGSTTNEIVDQLEIALLNCGIKAEFYQSEYAKYFEDAMFGNPELDSFNPDIIFIHTNWRNVLTFPQVSDSKEAVDAMLEAEFARFVSMWSALKAKFGCPIIQNNFDRPNYRLLGNRDIWDYRGRSNYLSRLNQKFYDYAQDESSFYINDIDYLAQDFGLTDWNDSSYWNMYKYACSLNAIPYLAGSVCIIIKSIFGKNKKLLALDLDNTLWGGIVGDDGVEGIKIGAEIPAGQAYFEFQEYCKALQQIGVVLAVDSKNDEANALAGLNHPDGVLRPDDFVSIKANWNPKDANLQEMASELSLGVDSFVFVDDNPAEQEIVKKQLPAVAVPAVENVEDYIKVLDHCGYFEVTALSTEDLKKTDQYKARAAAAAAQASFANYDEYLESLDMHAVITEFDPISIQRVAQLTNKTNQFNLTTLRCSEGDIRHMQESDSYICMCGRLIDKFADNGIVTVVAAEEQFSELHIRLWLMSCRVLKRDMEYVMMNELVAKAKERGIKKINGYYYPTNKNAMVKDFYQQMGFTLVSEDEQGNAHWQLEVADYDNREQRGRAIQLS
ncbi:MAG: HAD family hydrolase [Pseudobutyrivibrio sp.]|nr:HAD family hydrolase [Pseudobutyrivibrio sp.]